MNIVVKDSYSVVAGTKEHFHVTTSVAGVVVQLQFHSAVATGVSFVSAVEAVTTDVELATGAADSLDAVVAAVDVALLVASVATTSGACAGNSCMSFYLVSLDSIGQDGS